MNSQLCRQPQTASPARGAGARSRRGLVSIAAVVGLGAIVALSSSCRKSEPPPAPVEEKVIKQEPSAPTVQFPVALLSLEPQAAEYGTKPDRFHVQTRSGPGVIDTTPEHPINNAMWFWPDARKIVRQPPPEGYEIPEGQFYESANTNLCVSEGFFVTGVCLWARTRNMYHWIDYEIPAGATRFTADVLVSDDPLGWFTGQRDVLNQQFEFFVLVDDRELKKESATRLGKRRGSGEKLTSLDLALPPGAKRIRFRLDVTDWGDGNKNIELIITEGMFHNSPS